MKVIVVTIFLLIMASNTISGQVIVKSETNYCFMEMNGNSRSVQSCCYTIHNNDTTRMVLLFIEDDNSSRPHIELLKRKVLHRYGDFSLSMLEWEANMDVDYGCMVIPELFVKIINPHESFNVFYFSEEGSDVIIEEIPKHFLLCNERDFSSTQIGFQNFVKCIENYNYCYPYSYIILNNDVFDKFIEGSLGGIPLVSPCTQYFSRKSVEEIERISEDTLTFSTSYIDNTFKSLGTVLDPNIPFELKYDTLSSYTVVVGGNLFFSDTQEENVTDIKCDSVELSYVIVKKEGEKARRYSSKHHKSDIDKPWKDCPIPSPIMEKIRNDFFIRMKYRKYRVINKDSLKGLTVMHQYQLF